MATTSTWSITYPTTANAITPLATHFANLASSTDSALTSVRNQSGRYTGTNAQRLALTAALGRTKGTEFYTTDTDKNWLFDGTQWVSSDPGIFVIIPASVPSFFNIGADGSLTATTLPSGYYNFDNVFSSRFRNYRVEINLEGKSSASQLSDVIGRSGSSNISGNAFFQTEFGVIGAGSTASSHVAAAAGRDTFGALVDAPGTLNYTVLEIGSPFANGPTLMNSRVHYRGGAFGDRMKTASDETARSLTGISVSFGQIVQSVRIRFYGYV